MKTVWIIIALCTFQGLKSQIPNSSFELWEQKNNMEEPQFWKTNNQANFISVSKVPSLNQSGQYAMYLKSKGISFEGNGPGRASTTFKPTSTQQILSFFYKIDSIVDSQVELKISQKNNGVSSHVAIWKTDEIKPEGGTIYLSFAITSLDSLSLEVVAQTTMSPVGYKGYAEMIMDDLKLTSTSNVTHSPFSDIQIFPNPSEGRLIIKNGQHLKYKIFALNGALIQSGVISDDEILIDKKGSFILQIMQGGWMHNHRFINL